MATFFLGVCIAGVSLAEPSVFAVEERRALHAAVATIHEPARPTSDPIWPPRGWFPHAQSGLQAAQWPEAECRGSQKRGGPDPPNNSPNRKKRRGVSQGTTLQSWITSAGMLSALVGIAAALRGHRHARPRHVVKGIDAISRAGRPWASMGNNERAMVVLGGATRDAGMVHPCTNPRRDMGGTTCHCCHDCRRLR